jgi:isoaspartyl peptidase/L-asparaginase-like protein (Ntn-hydrolase superfamily)
VLNSLGRACRNGLSVFSENGDAEDAVVETVTAMEDDDSLNAGA